MTKTESALLKAVVHVIHSDGEVSEEERMLLGGILSQLGLNEDQMAQVADMMMSPPDISNLKDQVPHHESRIEILKVVLAMVLADGRIDIKELRVLNQMAKQLEISNEELEQLKRETMEAVEHIDE